ncbi:MAG TPA: hypothetical protein VG993_12980 [Actinomycetota bacterium]|nr:hypothetical protein [Actinomycetota bacterium]
MRHDEPDLGDRPRTTTGSAARDVRGGPDQDVRPGAEPLGHAEDRPILADSQGFVAAWKERLRRRSVRR